MIELILGTYGVACWLILVKSKLVKINSYSIFTAILGGVVLLVGILMLLSICHPVSHDGRLYAPVTPIVPQVRGIVTNVLAAPNSPLKEGDELFRIEQRPYQLEVDRLEATLAGMNTKAAQLETRLAGATAAVNAARSNLLVSESEFDRQARIALDRAVASITKTQSRLNLANINLERLQKLKASNAATQANLDAASSEVETLSAELAQAKSDQLAAEEKMKSGGDRLQSAREELKRAEAEELDARLAMSSESDGMNPEVRQTIAELDRKRWELEQTIVRAPSDGYVTHVSLRPGQMATPIPLTAPMAFVPKEKPMLIATYEQNAMAGIEPGLEAEIAFKSRPGRIYRAKVLRVQPIVPEGQFLASGQLRSATSVDSAGRIPVVFEYGDDVDELDLPIGSQASIAVYTHHVHAMGIVRKIILRIKSWENYLFFMQNMNALH